MRNLNSVLMIATMGILLSCGSATTAPTPQINTEDGRDDTTGTLYNANVNTNQAARTPEVDYSATKEINNSNMEQRQLEMRQLYTDLNMTEDQINRYERASDSASELWKKNNPGRTMGIDDIRMRRNQTLRPILDDTQYNQYQEWLRNNPNSQF